MNLWIYNLHEIKTGRLKLIKGSYNPTRLGSDLKIFEKNWLLIIRLMQNSIEIYFHDETGIKYVFIKEKKNLW